MAIAVLLFALAVPGLLGLYLRDEGPRYNGKSLSKWLELFRWPEANGGVPSEATLAIASIGTNALPCFMEWIRYELPPWRQILLKLGTQDLDVQKGTKVITGKSWIEGKAPRRAERVGWGFAILNTNAASAIPELEALMKDNQKPIVRQRAIEALGYIGGPALSALTHALADTNQMNRIEIIYAIKCIALGGNAAYSVERDSPSSYRDACMAALTRALYDPDDRVSRQAKITLYNVEHHAEIFAQLKGGRAFREHILQARTNARLKTALMPSPTRPQNSFALFAPFEAHSALRIPCSALVKLCSSVSLVVRLARPARPHPSFRATLYQPMGEGRVRGSGSWRGQVAAASNA